MATMNLLAAALFKPKRLSRLDFSRGIPNECATVVAVPTLLSSEEQVRHAVRGLEIRFLANRDANLHFSLLTDSPDSTQQFDEKERGTGRFVFRPYREAQSKIRARAKGNLFAFSPSSDL